MPTGSSGEKAQDTTRYWFDTRPNLRREMEDRKGRFDDRGEVLGKIAEVLKKLSGAGRGGLPGVVRECFRWLLCPVMNAPTDRNASVEVFPLSTGGGTYAEEIERVCQENELVIATWSPIHLRGKLRELYWKDGTTAVRAVAVWEDMQRYLYLPRLKRRSVLEQAITAGAASRDFFGTAYGQRGEKFEGFKLGGGQVQVDETLLLIEPEAAAAYEAGRKPSEPPPSSGTGKVGSSRGGSGGLVTPVAGGVGAPPVGGGAVGSGGVSPGGTGAQAPKAFFGSIEVNATIAKMSLVNIAEEIIAVLAADPNASVKVTLEISAEFPGGASEQTRRAVSENAASLGFKNKSWE